MQHHVPPFLDAHLLCYFLRSGCYKLQSILEMTKRQDIGETCDMMIVLLNNQHITLSKPEVFSRVIPQGGHVSLLFLYVLFYFCLYLCSGNIPFPFLTFSIHNFQMDMKVLDDSKLTLKNTTMFVVRHRCVCSLSPKGLSGGTIFFIVWVAVTLFTSLKFFRLVSFSLSV